jgi:hypothetical protein
LQLQGRADAYLLKRGRRRRWGNKGRKLALGLKGRVLKRRSWVHGSRPIGGHGDVEARICCRAKKTVTGGRLG